MTIFINGRDINKPQQQEVADTHEPDFSELLNITLANAKGSEYYILQQTYVDHDPVHPNLVPLRYWKGLVYNGQNISDYCTCSPSDDFVSLPFMKKYFPIVPKGKVPFWLHSYDKRFNNDYCW